MTTESSAEEKEAGYLADVGNSDAAQPAQDAKPEAAPSSDADAPDAKPEAPESFLDAVKAAAKSAPKDADPSSKVETETDPAKPAEGAKPKEGDGKVDDSKLPFHTHPRWQQVTKDLKATTERVKALETETESLKGDAEIGRNFVSEVRARGLSAQEFQDGFEIMGLMKSDPTKARALLQVHMDRLGAFTGDALSPDLQEQIDNGEITEKTARELQILRATNSRNENLSKAQIEQSQRAGQVEAQQRIVADVTKAGDAWYGQQQKSDPDWDKKQPLVIMAAQALIASEGYPTNADQAVALLNKANASVNAQIAPFRPKPTATPRPVTGGASGSNNPVPKSMREAMELGLRKSA